MKESGGMEKNMDMEYISFIMETNMKETLLMINLKGRELFIINPELNILANGKMI